MSNVTREDVLEALGLLPEQRSFTDNLLPALGLFGAGIVVGAGIALMTSPKPGRELREDIGRRAGDLGRRASELGTQLRERIPAGRGGSERELGTSSTPYGSAPETTGGTP